MPRQIAPGLRADLAIWNVEHPAELAYRIGFNPLQADFWRARMTLTLNPGAGHACRPARTDLAHRSKPLRPTAPRPGIEAAAALVRGGRGDEAVYGVNTGFGKLASVRIKPRTRHSCSAT
jgi:hypothetical protein